MHFSLPYLISILTKFEPTLAVTASLIANSEFEYQKTTSIVWQQADFDLVTKFLAIYQGSVETIHMYENQDRFIDIQQAILFVTSSYEFHKFVANLTKNVTSSSKVVTVVTNPIPDLSNITEIAWKYYITDFIILIQNENQSAAYTYYPYRDNKCGNTSPLKVDYKENFFPIKFKNLLGCQTRVGTWAIAFMPYFNVKCGNGSHSFFKGIFGNLFTIIAQHMNTTVKVSCENYIKITHSLNEGNIHVLTPVVLLDWHTSTYQTTGIIHIFELVWCGPPQREFHVWIKVLVPFMNIIIVLLCAAFIVLVVLLKIISKIEPINKSFHIVWNILAILLGQQAEYVTKSRLMNFLFLLWIWFSMVVTTAYNGLLVKGLQTKLLEPRFDTVENAVHLVDGYGGIEWYKEWYKGTPIWNRFETITLDEEVKNVRRISQGKRYLQMNERLILLGYRLQILKRTAGVEYSTTLVRARWGGGVIMKTAQSRLIEAGILQKIIRDEELAVASRQAKLRRNSSDTDAGHLDMVKLSSCFFFLGIMCLVCCLILLFEIVHHWLQKPNVKGKFQAKLF
ncbi:uncharacterized protein LOC134798148 [Cydia splendana]|uniref:uncharacterized protein LOC134798148 n=1 Tax=Cydia splendana TaxID=1100963 RepID=UPI00300BFBD5